MSKGALKELGTASISKFINLIKNIPQSEKIGVIRFLNNRVIILGEI